MTDLISRAATLERMKSMAGCATCDNYNYVRCRACIWDDAMNIVDEVPAMDAIHMDWIQKFCEDDISEDQRETIAWMLEVWKREREARST